MKRIDIAPVSRNLAEVYHVELDTWQGVDSTRVEVRRFDPATLGEIVQAAVTFGRAAGGLFAGGVVEVTAGTVQSFVNLGGQIAETGVVNIETGKRAMDVTMHVVADYEIGRALLKGARGLNEKRKGLITFER